MIKTQNINFESVNFNPFETSKSILLNNDFDPDNNLFNEDCFQNLNAKYFTINETKNTFQNSNSDSSLSILHLNIRSMNKNFGNFKNVSF